MEFQIIFQNDSLKHDMDKNVNKTIRMYTKHIPVQTVNYTWKNQTGLYHIYTH